MHSKLQINQRVEVGGGWHGVLGIMGCGFHCRACVLPAAYLLLCVIRLLVPWCRTPVTTPTHGRWQRECSWVLLLGPDFRLPAQPCVQSTDSLLIWAQQGSTCALHSRTYCVCCWFYYRDVCPAGLTRSGSTTKSMAASPLTLLLAAATAAAVVASAAAVWVVLCATLSRRLVTLPAPPRKWCRWKGRQQVRVVVLSQGGSVCRA